MVPGTRTKKLKILQNRCRTGNQELNQEVQALTSWVDQEVIGLTGMLLAFYKKLLFFYQDNRLNYDYYGNNNTMSLFDKSRHWLNYVKLCVYFKILEHLKKGSLALNKIRAKSMCIYYDKISKGWGLVPKGGEYKDNFKQGGWG